MNYKSFEKNQLEAFASKFGFTSIDDSAFVKLVLMIELLIQNMLDNVLAVKEHLNITIIKKKHLETVLTIIEHYKRQNIGHFGGDPINPSEYYGIDSGKYVINPSFQNGIVNTGVSRPALIVQQSAGDPVLPSEYYGENSGRYVSIDTFQPIQSNVTRSALALKIATGGCGSCGFLTKPLIALIVKTHLKQVKFASNAYEIVASSVEKNLSELLKQCKMVVGPKKNAKRILTTGLILKAIKKQPCEYMHMTHLWK